MRSNVLSVEGAEEMSDNPGEVVTTIDSLVEVHEVTNS